jgi:hypothetical protein
MRSIVDSEVKFIEDNSLSLSLTCTHELCITLHSQRLSKLLNITQDVAVITQFVSCWLHITSMQPYVTIFYPTHSSVKEETTRFTYMLVVVLLTGVLDTLMLSLGST